MVHRSVDATSLEIKLESRRLAPIAEAEQREAKPIQTAPRPSRQTARRTASSAALRQNKRDMGLGD